jgi:hypothetical protein
VARGLEEENVVYEAGSRKEDVEVLEQDIKYIHLNNLMLLDPHEQFYGSSFFYGLILLLIGLLIALYFLSKRYKSKQADIVGMRKSKAKRLAIKRMSKAKKLLEQKNISSFYEEVAQALYGYFADRYNIGVADLSKESLLERLEKEGADQAVLSQLNLAIDNSEMARYAPSSAVEPNDLYESAKEIIEQTEDLKS